VPLTGNPGQARFWLESGTTDVNSKVHRENRESEGRTVVSHSSQKHQKAGLNGAPSLGEGGKQTAQVLKALVIFARGGTTEVVP
jgi:hypothetical protein